MNIQDIRSKYPQYSDLSDQQLADALHTKFYSAIPKEDFYSRIGFEPSYQGNPVVNALKETGKRAVGVARGVAKGTVGATVDLVNESPRLLNILPGKQGIGPISDNPYLGTKDIDNAFSSTFGELAQKPERGGYLEDAAEFASGFYPVGSAVQVAREAAPLIKAAKPYKAAQEVKKFIVDESGKLGGAAANKADNIVEGARDLVRDYGLPKEVKDMSPSEKLLFREYQKDPNLFAQAQLEKTVAGELNLDLPLYSANRRLTGYADRLAIQGETSNLADKSIKNLKGQLGFSVRKALRAIGKNVQSPQQAGETLKQATDQVVTAMYEQRRKLAQPLYEKVMKPLNTVPAVNSLYKEPIFAKALKGVEKDPVFLQTLYRDHGVNPQNISVLPKDSIVYLDAVQKILRSAAQGAQLSEPRRAFLLFDARDRLLKEIDKKYPAYAKARQLWAGESQGIEHVREQMGLDIIQNLAERDLDKAGQKMANVAPEFLADIKRQYSTVKNGEKAFEQAFLGDLERTLLNTKDAHIGGFSKAIFGSPYQRERVVAALDKPRADALGTFLHLFDKAAESTRIGKGSQTAERQLINSELRGAEVPSIGLPTKRGLFEKAIETTVEQVFQPYAKTVFESPEETKKLFDFLFTDKGWELMNKFNKAQKIKNPELAKKTLAAIVVGATSYEVVN